MCLRRLPESMASQGHYPSEAMKGSPSQTELQCSDCNSAMNYQYEHAAQGFFTRQWDVGFGPKGGGQIQFKAEVVTENGVLRIRRGVAAYLGLGMWWRSLVTVLPFANDENGECWERVARVAALGQTQRVREMNLRVAFGKVQPTGLRDEVVFENTETGETLEMTHRLSDDELRLLVAGQSPFQLDPPRPS